MTFSSPTGPTRRAAPSHRQWPARAYQRRAVDFLTAQASAALFLDPGLGKTAIVLDAFRRLKERGVARRMLVIAPLRVCQTVWREEGLRWTEFRDLRFSLLHGSKKAERLRDDADIWLINPEGVKWLRDRFPMGRGFAWDTVTLDELTKFKNPTANRSKSLRAMIRHTPRRWGLTGTPAPNGYLDLFGQMLVLDDGVALGKYLTHYRDQYFQADYMGFNYTLRPGAAANIEDRLRPYVLRMSAEDYLELPALVDDVRAIDMPPDARKTYVQMRKDMLADLPEGVVTGANAAAVYSKLKQMANGAVYVNNKREVSIIHSAKMEALDELIDELAGQQLLIGYEFQHDVDRLKARFGDALYTLDGSSGARANEIVTAWNAGKIQLLACHPASAAHGLNLQYGGCAHVCWLSPIWDLELYQQFIRRIWRQGTEAQRVVNHLLCMKDTIDELALEALRDKDVTQSRLLRGLNAEILRDAETHGDGVSPRETRTTAMTVAKLSRQQDASAEEPRRVAPKGWGRAAPAADADQRERIQTMLRGGDAPEPTPAEKARAAFSEPLRTQIAAMEGDTAPDDSPKPKWGAQTDIEDFAPTGQRQASDLTVEKVNEAPTTPSAKKAKRSPAVSVEAVGEITPDLRYRCVELALAHSKTLPEALEVAKEIVDFVRAA